MAADADNLFSHEDAESIQLQLNTLRETRDIYGDSASFQITADLDLELCQQATKFLTVCEAVAQARSISDGLKLTLDREMAFAQMRTRQSYENGTTAELPFPINGKLELKLSKSTEGVISAAVEQYDHILLIRQTMILASYYVNELGGIREAWLQRSIMLKTLVERQIACSYSGEGTGFQHTLANRGQQVMARDRDQSRGSKSKEAKKP